MSPAGSQLEPPGLQSMSSVLMSFHSLKFSKGEDTPKINIRIYKHNNIIKYNMRFFHLHHFRHQNLPVPNTHKKYSYKVNSLLWQVNRQSRQTGQQLAGQHLEPWPRGFTGLWRIYFLQISSIVKRERRYSEVVTYRNIQCLYTLPLSSIFWVRLSQIL